MDATTPAFIVGERKGGQRQIDDYSQGGSQQSNPQCSRMEFSLFEIAGLVDCVKRMERVPNRRNQFLCHWVTNSSRLIFLVRDFDLGQEFAAREFGLLIVCEFARHRTHDSAKAEEQD